MKLGAFHVHELSIGIAANSCNSNGAEGLYTRKIIEGVRLSNAPVQVYLNFASRVNADTKMIQPLPEPLPDACGVVQSSLHAAALTPSTASTDAGPAMLDKDKRVRLQSPKKRARLEARAALIETDLDWDAKPDLPVSRSEAGDNAKRDAAHRRQALAKPSKREAGKQQTSLETHGDKCRAPIQACASEKAHEAALSPAYDSAATSVSLADDPWETTQGSRNETLVRANGKLSSSSRQDEAFREGRHLSAAALEDYSPSRHGGESPPRVQPGMQEGLSYQVSLPQ